jgi:hypothetical protein
MLLEGFGQFHIVSLFNAAVHERVVALISSHPNSPHSTCSSPCQSPGHPQTHGWRSASGRDPCPTQLQLIFSRDIPN